MGGILIFDKWVFIRNVTASNYILVLYEAYLYHTQEYNVLCGGHVVRLLYIILKNKFIN